jgi:hypothetical protein
MLLCMPAGGIVEAGLSIAQDFLQEGHCLCSAHVLYSSAVQQCCACLQVILGMLCIIHAGGVVEAGVGIA